MAAAGQAETQRADEKFSQSIAP